MSTIYKPRLKVGDKFNHTNGKNYNPGTIVAVDLAKYEYKIKWATGFTETYGFRIDLMCVLIRKSSNPIDRRSNIIKR